MRCLLGAAVAMTASVNPIAFSGAVAQDRDFEWSGRMSAGQTLEVFGVNGWIRASPADRPEAEVRARILEGRHGDPAAVRVDVVEHDRGVTICAVYPGRRGRRNECRPGGGDQQAQSTVRSRAIFRSPSPVASPRRAGCMARLVAAVARCASKR